MTEENLASPPRFRAPWWQSIAIIASVMALASIFPERRVPDAERDTDHGAKQRETVEAATSERGRDAETPAQIPASGWKDILKRTYEQVGKDRLLAVAAGVVFYGLLAIFPAVTALVVLRAVRGSKHDQQAPCFHIRCVAGGHVLHRGGADQTRIVEGRRQIGGILRLRTCPGHLECERRHEGNHRRSQRRVRRG